jgi:hypothetical protein
MTRGIQVAVISRDVRARRNPLIRQRKSKQGKMFRAAVHRDGSRFAQSAEKAEANHCTARELTPGPQGSGED